jgi:MFS family permease
MLTSAAATLALGLAAGLALIIALAAVTGLASELYRPATSAIMAAAVPAGPARLTAFSVYQLGVSAGTAAGPAVGGIVAEHSFLALFAADAATSAAWGILAWVTLPGTRPGQAGPRPTSPAVLADRRLLRMTAATFLVNLILFQAQTTFPLWVHRQGLSSAAYGLLLALNSALIMLLQIPSTRLTARASPPAVISLTSIVTGGGFALLALGHGAAVLALAVIVWSLGELTQWPVAAAYTTSLAPAGLTGRYAGTRSLAYGAALLAAPLAGTALYHLNPATLWTGCLTIGILAALTMIPGPRRRRPGPDTGAAGSVTAQARAGPALTNSAFPADVDNA